MIFAQRAYIILFAVNIVLIFSYVGFRNSIMRLSRKEQELEKQKQLLTAQKNERELYISELKNPASLKKIADNKAMEKLRLSRIKRILRKDNA